MRQIEAGTDNINLLEKITFLLEEKDYTENEVFYTAATQLHDLDPTAGSAYDMGNMSIAKKNYSDAVSYYNQAIQLQEDIDYKASYYLKLAYANQMKGSFSDARSAATKAANLKPHNCVAFFLKKLWNSYRKKLKNTQKIILKKNHRS